jgi:hypothetical protein
MVQEALHVQQAQQQQQPPDQPPEEPVAKKPRGYSDRRIRELSQDLTAHVESVGSPGRQGLVVKGFLERVDPRVLQAAGATLPSHAEASAIIVANLAGNLALNAPQPGNHLYAHMQQGKQGMEDMPPPPRLFCSEWLLIFMFMTVLNSAYSAWEGFHVYYGDLSRPKTCATLQYKTYTCACHDTCIVSASFLVHTHVYIHRITPIQRLAVLSFFVCME